MNQTTLTANAATDAAKPRKKLKFHPFLPGFLDRAGAIRWLKKIHAWTGLWGALMFLLMGVSGFLLNHSKSVAKIDTGAAREVSSVAITVDPASLQTIEELSAWASQEFNTPIKPTQRRASADTKTERVVFMGREVDASDLWQLRLYAPNAIIMIEYYPGSTVVKATKSAQNGWGLIKNLHKASGLGIAWVLFLDVMAGALIAMSLTGALLWSRLHGTRLTAIAIVLASLGMALTAALPRLL